MFLRLKLFWQMYWKEYGEGIKSFFTYLFFASLFIGVVFVLPIGLAMHLANLGTYTNFSIILVGTGGPTSIIGTMVLIVHLNEKKTDYKKNIDKEYVQIIKTKEKAKAQEGMLSVADVKDHVDYLETVANKCVGKKVDVYR